MSDVVQGSCRSSSVAGTGPGHVVVLLSDPDAELSSWPVDLVALRDKLHGDAARAHPHPHPNRDSPELSVSGGREELAAAGGETVKWRQRRNHSFDQNRQLEEITRERDGLKRVAASLQLVVGQLVSYCVAAEDELNRTVLGHLLPPLLHAHDRSVAETQSRASSPDVDGAVVSGGGGKHVHFAPELGAVLAELGGAGAEDADGLLAAYLREQRDLSAEIKCELDHSLRRLRREAHDLLQLSTRLNNNNDHNESDALEASEVEITELVEALDSKDKPCDRCQLYRKDMEEAMAECLQRENLLRSELEAAMTKIAHFVTGGDHSTELIAEGYGIGQSSPRPLPRPRPHSESGTSSLDGGTSPRAHLLRMAHDLEVLQRERDDLHQQLEAANRQLRSTRQFLEEQGAEREAERDEYARRLGELRDENSRLATRLHNNARILNEVEQLEAQTKEMNQIIAELETRKASTDEELKAASEEIPLLRDIIFNLESQLEQKTVRETEVLEQLEQMKKTIDERDSKMRSLLGELESLRSERVEMSDVGCVKCGQEEEKYAELLNKINEQCRWLEEKIHRRTQKMERMHEVCSASCSEPSEDVSLREQKDLILGAKSPGDSPNRSDLMPELLVLWEELEACARAEDAALKRISDLEMQRAQLKDVAQEVRAERDVLQARMSEQALRISSLSARLDQQRHNAEALAHQATSQLSVQLHDALAEVQRLKDELQTKDKQLARLKQSLESKDRENEKHAVYGNTCSPKDKFIILERELCSAQARIAQLESMAKDLDRDKGELLTRVAELQQVLLDKDKHLQQLLALKLDDDIQKNEKSDVMEGAKMSARTLSDIVSISEYDEQDLQMRRAELKNQNLSLSGTPYPTDSQDKTHINRTVPPQTQRPNISSLNLEYMDNFESPNYTPRADSLPAHLTSTQNRDLITNCKRNVNETILLGTINKFGDGAKHSTAVNIPDNCSMYPNKDADTSKNVSMEPKKINFSLEMSNENKTRDEEEFISLKELGVTLDVRQENFPDILTQIKNQIKKYKSEIDNYKFELKNAEEQLCEFPALKEEVEQLKNVLENTVAAMENDKKFYENQLENFSSNKKMLEQRLNELTHEVSDKSKDLHLLKEDILRRENMILELAKEKRNLSNKMAELKLKADQLENKNIALEKIETENHEMRKKMSELQKLEQMVSEKNQQIDSLNQHLDRLDDLKRCLTDKTEELENLKEAYEKKSNELYQLQLKLEKINCNIASISEENNNLNTDNVDLKMKVTKLEKEQEISANQLLKTETELSIINNLNKELTAKLEELKIVNDKLKDKETEIEILNEDISCFHAEIASLKEQLKMVSRSPSPKGKGAEDKKNVDRQASSDKKQLVKIRKQISLLQHELDFNKKELNDKAFELARAKLDMTEMRSKLSQMEKLVSDKAVVIGEMQKNNINLEEQINELRQERHQLNGQLELVVSRLREESNMSELKAKLREKVERCEHLEQEVRDLRELLDRMTESPGRHGRDPLKDQRALVLSGARSPTAELERAVRDQLDYSHRLDEDIMDQILSGSSDEREDVPRLALDMSNGSRSSSSAPSSSSERMARLRTENEKLALQVAGLQARLQDKDALITELNRIRDKLVQDWQAAQLRLEAERDHSGRLQLLLDTHKDTADSLQNQDSKMIQTLKKRLESAMQSELELQQQVQQLRGHAAQLERQLVPQPEAQGSPVHRKLHHEMDVNERLKGEVSVLKSRLEVERARGARLEAAADQQRARLQRELDLGRETCAELRGQLAELKRLKHDSNMERLRAKELIAVQQNTIAGLEKKLGSPQAKHRAALHTDISDALTEIEGHKTELAREIAGLKKCIAESASPEMNVLREERRRLADQVEELRHQLQLKTPAPLPAEDKDQAIRYLHGRCLKLESFRKALVWQKRYLQKILAGYAELEKNLRLPLSKNVEVSRGKKRFKCIAVAVVVVLRMGFLVRRRLQARAVAAACVLRPRDPQPPAPVPTTPAPAGASVRGESLARRALRLATPSTAVKEYSRGSPYSGVQHNEPFVLSSPRAEMASAYLNKLDLVSRCLNQAMDATGDVP